MKKLFYAFSAIFLSGEETKLDDCHLKPITQLQSPAGFYTKVVLQHPGRAPGIFMIAILLACHSFMFLHFSVYVPLRSML
jgi:hypothetical protein